MYLYTKSSPILQRNSFGSLLCCIARICILAWRSVFACDCVRQPVQIVQIVQMHVHVYICVKCVRRHNCIKTSSIRLLSSIIDPDNHTSTWSLMLLCVAICSCLLPLAFAVVAVGGAYCCQLLCWRCCCCHLPMLVQNTSVRKCCCHRCIALCVPWPLRPAELAVRSNRMEGKAKSGERRVVQLSGSKSATSGKCAKFK